MSDESPLLVRHVAVTIPITQELYDDALATAAAMAAWQAMTPQQHAAARREQAEKNRIRHERALADWAALGERLQGNPVAVAMLTMHRPERDGADGGVVCGHCYDYDESPVWWECEHYTKIKEAAGV